MNDDLNSVSVVVGLTMDELNFGLFYNIFKRLDTMYKEAISGDDVYAMILTTVVDNLLAAMPTEFCEDITMSVIEPIMTDIEDIGGTPSYDDLYCLHEVYHDLLANKLITKVCSDMNNIYKCDVVTGLYVDFKQQDRIVITIEADG